MRATRIPFLLLLLCLAFVLLDTAEAGQVEQLRRLIRSKRSPSWRSPQSDPWPDLDATDDGSGSHEVYLSPQDGLQEADRITALPGQPKGVNLKQYSGYVTVDGKNGRALFYYFVESPTNSSVNPLVLWLNGGPGCSSLGYGAMSELGPFRVKSDLKTLESNIHAWTNVANVLFLESPAGVGFSYSNTSSDYASGDKRTALDSYTFLLNWLRRFPQYKQRPFFITGESYAGHYIPQLASLILQRNKLANKTLINLKGIAIGNGYLHQLINFEATYEHYWGHALISEERYAELRAACNFSALSDACYNVAYAADKDAGDIDPYDVYAPVCLTTTKTSSHCLDPCKSNYVQPYLNLPDVQKALHAKNFSWVSCTSKLMWQDSPESILPVIKQIIDSGLVRVWLYSGDADSICAYKGTVKAVNSVLKLPITSAWRPWYTHLEVGGYLVGYKGLVLVTVRGAGHTVPFSQSLRALVMFRSFLKGELPPPHSDFTSSTSA